jgi:hypothetical protein
MIQDDRTRRVVGVVADVRVTAMGGIGPYGAYTPAPGRQVLWLCVVAWSRTP